TTTTRMIAKRKVKPLLFLSNAISDRLCGLYHRRALLPAFYVGLHYVMVDQRCHHVHEEDREHHALRVGGIHHADQDREQADQEAEDPLAGVRLGGRYRIGGHED